MPITKRVPTSGATAGTPGSIGTDTWGGTWGNSWGRTWFNSTPPTGGSDASPAVNATPRLSGAPGGVLAKRVTVPHPSILLAGDQQSNGDKILLEGDVQTGSDVLDLEGDQDVFAANITKRVSS